MPTETASATTNGEVTYLDGITEALRIEMDADPDVFLLGEDIGAYGGAFKATKGLLERFGPEARRGYTHRRSRLHRPRRRRGADGTAARGRVPVR